MRLTFTKRGNSFVFLFALIVTLSANTSLFAQTRTIISSGSWTNTAIWDGGSIANTIGENASFTNNTPGTVTLQSPENITVGNVALNSGNRLTIASGATLNVGSSSASRNLTTGNDCTIIVSGTLIVWGTFNPDNNFSINITSTGVLIVKGGFSPGNDSDFTSSGSVDIGGAFSLGNNGDVIISGPMDVGGNFTYGNDAEISLNSPGDLNVSGNLDGNNNATVNIANGAGITVGGMFDVGNDAAVNVNGDLDIDGDFRSGNNIDITVGANGDLSVGEDFDTGNDAAIIINGDMDVDGDFSGNNNMDLTIGNNGDFDTGGDVDLGNGSDIVVDGSWNIGGGYDGGTDNDFDVDGLVTIGGDIEVDNDSNATGSGSAIVTGTCTDGNSNFCGTGPFNNLLPIRLVYFKVSLNDDNNVSIKWATEEELSFDYFELERASKGLEFSMLAKISGAGYNTESRQEYSWTDTNPLAGDNYYRLKAVDLDGSFEYFDVKFVAVSAKRTFSVFPNPATGEQINYSINFDYTDSDRIIVFDNMGQALQNIAVSAIEDEIHFSERLKPGVYVLQYVSARSKHNVRLVVR